MEKLNKKQKTWLGIGGGVAFLATIIGISRAKKKKREQDMLSPDYSFPISSYNEKKVITFPLKHGDYNNPFVKRFQKWANKQIGKVRLIKGHLPLLVEDGDFGDNTLTFVNALLKSDTISKSNFDKYGM